MQAVSKVLDSIRVRQFDLFSESAWDLSKHYTLNHTIDDTQQRLKTAFSTTDRKASSSLAHTNW